LVFFVDSKVYHLVTNFTPINKRLCILRIKGRFFNYSLINIPAPTNDSEEEAHDQFYEQLERAFSACLKNDLKLVMEDTLKSEEKQYTKRLLGDTACMIVQTKTTSDQEHVLHVTLL
jgi:hypothetical protein